MSKIIISSCFFGICLEKDLIGAVNGSNCTECILGGGCESKFAVELLLFWTFCALSYK